MHSMMHHYTSHAMHHGVVSHYLLQLAAARSVLLVVCTSVDVVHHYTSHAMHSMMYNPHHLLDSLAEGYTMLVVY